MEKGENYVIQYLNELQRLQTIVLYQDSSATAYYSELLEIT
jgi:hypothetical protein